MTEDQTKTHRHAGKEQTLGLERAQKHNVHHQALTTALPRTLPVCVSFSFLAMSYGVLMGTRGFSFLWPMCMSAFIFTDQWMTTQHKSHMAALTGNHNIPEAIAIITIILLHLWKKNMLLSIAGGTATYMLLIQLVF